MYLCFYVLFFLKENYAKHLVRNSLNIQFIINVAFFLHLNHCMWGWVVPYYRPKTRQKVYMCLVNLCRMCMLGNGILTLAVMTKSLNLELCCTMPYETTKTHCVRQRGRVDYPVGPFNNPRTRALP